MNEYEFTKKISTKISNSLTTLVVFTWNNFWGNNEGDPGHDDKEAGGKVDLQQDWSSPPHHLHLNNVGFDQFCHQCDISEGQISISPLSSKIIKGNNGNNCSEGLTDLKIFNVLICDIRILKC